MGRKKKAVAEGTAGAAVAAEAEGSPEVMGGFNKSAAIKAMLQKMGMDAKPADVVAAIKAETGNDVPATYVSTIRTNMEKKASGASGLNKKSGKGSASGVAGVISGVMALASEVGGIGELRRIVEALDR